MPIEKVMCAFNRKHKQRHERYPAYVQPKLDGLRCTWEDGRLWSRDRKPWNHDVLDHIYESLAGVSAPLDGEIYVHGYRLQQINSMGGVKRVEPHEKRHLLEFHVFDIIHKAPFEQRHKVMQRDIPTIGGAVKLVPTFYCENIHFCSELFKMFRREGYEGAMIRRPDAPYGFPELCTNQENRWNYLLKYKEWLDVDARIVGFNEGDKSFRGTLGSLELMLPNGVTFSAGSGLSHGDRDYIWHNQSRFVGTNVKIQYETLSGGGVPLKPVVLCVDEL